MTPGAGMAADRLTISIVSHGHGRLLAGLLNDLSGFASLCDVSVIVTLNVPEPDFATDCWPQLDLRVLRNAAPRGFGANHNAAFAHCGSGWFAVLNPDIRLPQDPFPALMAAAHTQRRPGVVAPRIVNPEGREEDAVRENLTPASLLRRRFDSAAGRARVSVEGSAAAGPRAFFWLAGMFLLFSAQAYRAIGGFDERFFLYCEDYDICARLHLSGAEIGVMHLIVVVHDAQRDSHRSSRHLRWHLSSLARVWTSLTFWRVTFGAGKLR